MVLAYRIPSQVYFLMVLMMLGLTVRVIFLGLHW